MKYLSVCSGIEAATVAWHSLGWLPVGFSEIEPFPCSVLAHHYPTVPNYGDMTKLAARVLSGEIEAPDVLVGGTPCQAYSVAGMRAGLNDDRGQLTLRFMELADAIDHVRTRAGKPPCVVVWENVPGVLSDKTNAFGCFLAGLAGEDVELFAPRGKWSNAGCVYGPQRAIAWRTLDAQYFGLAQRRRRVFVVASARNGFDPATVLFEWDGMRRDTAPSREAGKAVAALTSTGVGTCGADDNQAQAGHLLPVASTGSISHCLNAGGMGRQDYETETVIVQSCVGVSPTLRAGGNSTGGDRPPGTDVDTVDSLIVQSVALRGRDGGGTAELGGDLANALRCGGGGGDKPHVLAPYTVRDVAQTITSNYGKQCDNSDTALGPNVVMSPVTAFSCKDHGADASQEIAPTMRAMNHAGSRANAGGQLAVQLGMAVRRLMPIECERLQGFPDNYTLAPHRGKSAADGPRYKAIGNSMAVPVMRWIGRRIDQAVQQTAAKVAA